MVERILKLEKDKKIIMILMCASVFVIFTMILINDLHVSQNERNMKEAFSKGYLVYGADDSSPPLRFLDEDGVYKGVVVDYMNQLSLELGVEIKTVPYKFEEGLEALKNGETDLNDIFANEDRAKYYVFSDPIYILRTVMSVSAESHYTLDNVNQMKIATQKGDYANWYLQKNYPDCQLVMVHDVGEALTLLVEHKVDGAIGDEPVLYYYANKLGYIDKIQNLSTALYEEPVVIAMPKSEGKLIPYVNRAIKEVNKKGQLEKIQQKWFGISTPLKTVFDATKVSKYIIYAILAVGIMLISFSIHAYYLRILVRRRTKELELSRNELNLILNKLPESVLLVDKNKKIINGNLSFKGEDIDKQSDIICRLLLEKYCMKRTAECKSCEDNCILEEVLSQKKEVMFKAFVDGEYFKVYAVPIKLSEKGYEKKSRDKKNGDMVLIILRNTTIEEINSRHLLQSSKMMAVGQLAAGMAHEIKNPLGVIRNQSYVLEKLSNDDKNIKKSLKYINDNVNRATSIIDNVMNFWRVSNDKASIVNLYELFESIIMLQKSDIKSKSINVEIDCPKELELYSSSESLKHILINVISNSIDAMENGGKIVLSAKKTKNGVMLCCEDNGDGIAEEDMTEIFNPFFTTKEPGKGTGLGLFIVYSEVEKLGGQIEFESKKHNYTKCIINIPDRGEIYE